MIRQPPLRVPRLIAVYAASSTHNGMSNVGIRLPAYRAPAMIPMVFCASLAPWLRLYAAADRSCRRRNQWSTRDGENERNNQRTATIKRKDTTNPIKGDSTMKVSVIVQPDAMIAFG